MSTISVWTFAAPDGAAENLRFLERLQTLGRLRIADSAVVEWWPDRPRPEAYQVGSPSRATMLAGAFWGLLFSILFLLPLAGFPPSITVTAGGLARIGLPEPLLEEVRRRSVRGTSTLFLLTDDSEVERVRSAIADARSTATPSSTGLISILTEAENAALRRAFSENDS